MSTIPQVLLPHPVAGSGAEAMATLAEALAPRLWETLQGAGSGHLFMSVLEARDEADAQEQLYQLGCTRWPSRDHSHGSTGRPHGAGQRPGRFSGARRLWGLRGCRQRRGPSHRRGDGGMPPELMPVLCAVAEAVLDPAFDLTEMQATTHCTAPLILLSGPVVEALGFASGFGALGPGHRANATLGRALRLAMINIGGGRPGESDMALLGHPGKFTYCLAEAAEASPSQLWASALALILRIAW